MPRRNNPGDLVGLLALLNAARAALGKPPLRVTRVEDEPLARKPDRYDEDFVASPSTEHHAAASTELRRSLTVAEEPEEPADPALPDVVWCEQVGARVGFLIFRPGLPDSHFELPCRTEEQGKVVRDRINAMMDPRLGAPAKGTC